MSKIYVVTMYRFADREKHSYVHHACLKKHEALKAAEDEKDYRGGNKYWPEVIEFGKSGARVILPLGKGWT